MILVLESCDSLVTFSLLSITFFMSVGASTRIIFVRFDFFFFFSCLGLFSVFFLVISGVGLGSGCDFNVKILSLGGVWWLEGLPGERIANRPFLIVVIYLKSSFYLSWSKIGTRVEFPLEFCLEPEPCFFCISRILRCEEISRRN